MHRLDAVQAGHQRADGAMLEIRQRQMSRWQKLLADELGIEQGVEYTGQVADQP